MVAINAIRAPVRTTEHEGELLQKVGALPTPLSNLGQQIDLHRVAQQAVEVLDRHGVPVAVKRDLVAALGGVCRSQPRWIG